MISGASVGIAVAVLALTPAEFDVARFCFWVSAGAIVIATIVSLLGVAWPFWQRAVVAGVIGAATMILLVEAIRLVGRREALSVAATSAMPLPAPEPQPPQTLSADEIADAVVRRTARPEPSAADKRHRADVRKELSNLLSRGGVHRQNLRGILSLYRDGFWTDEETLTRFYQESNAITEWEIEIAKYVYANFGEARAAWCAAPLPVTDYPDTSPLKKLPGGSTDHLEDSHKRKWESVSSRMAKLEQLLREYPDL